MDTPQLIDAIDLLLPQTQCTKCGYHGCRPYAEAIAQGDAINKCPPGGDEGIQKLAGLLDRPVLALDTSHGEHNPVTLVAHIREAECIGCTKCIQACPVDAIVGAAKLMHSVLIDHCTGCDLCVAPCPVDCIDMLPLPIQPDDTAKQTKTVLSRARFEKRKARLAKIQQDKQHAKKIQAATITTAKPSSAVAEALATIQAQTEKPAADQRAKLERNLAAAIERVERAEQKLELAKRKTPEMLPQLEARLQDMRFKVREFEQKLAELEQAPAEAVNMAQQAATQAAEAALARMLAARAQLSNSERLQKALATLDRQIQSLTEDLTEVDAEELPVIQADLDRLQAKREVVVQERQEAQLAEGRPAE